MFLFSFVASPKKVDAKTSLKFSAEASNRFQSRRCQLSVVDAVLTGLREAVDVVAAERCVEVVVVDQPSVELNYCIEFLSELLSKLTC